MLESSQWRTKMKTNQHTAEQIIRILTQADKGAQKIEKSVVTMASPLNGRKSYAFRTLNRTRSRSASDEEATHVEAANRAS